MSSFDQLAQAKPAVRRGRLGPARRFESALEGQLVTFVGVVEAPVEVVAETHVSQSRVLASHRCRAAAVLRVRSEPVLLEGPLAVVVGSHERLRAVASHGIVSFRELRSGCLVRARGLLRRVPAPGPQRYRSGAAIWALCATGTGDMVDVALEAQPTLLERPSLWERLTEWEAASGVERVDTDAPSLRELLRRRRDRHG